MSAYASILSVQKAASTEFNVTLEEMTGARRARQFARPRQVAMTIAYEVTTRSASEIGHAFGGRDHATVFHAIRTVRNLMPRDPDLAARYRNVRVRLQRGAVDPTAAAAEGIVISTFDALEKALVAAARRDPARVMRMLASLVGFDRAIAQPTPARDVAVGQNWSFPDHRTLKEVP